VEAKSKWVPQSEILFTFSWDGKAYTDKGLIIQFDREKVFSYLYWSTFSGLPDSPKNYSRIEFLLEPTENGVTLKLTHSHFASVTMYKHSDKNWEETLDEIMKLAEQ
jgi:Activator of Hsp90 ATPase homolog 1-like protein